jgi:hypothetical protein
MTARLDSLFSWMTNLSTSWPGLSRPSCLGWHCALLIEMRGSSPRMTPEIGAQANWEPLSQPVLPRLGDQPIARAVAHQMGKAREMQMHAGDKELVGRDHVEHLAA